VGLGYAIYEVYIAKEWNNIQTGNDVIVEVTSRDDLTSHLVKARIAESKEQLPDGKELWVRTESGTWLPKNPWAIKVLEELDPDEVSFTPQPATIKPLYGSGR